MPEVLDRSGVILMTEDQAAAWLAAMIDGEGSVSKGPRSRSVTVANKNVFVLAQVSYCLALFGIEHGFYGRHDGCCSVRVTARRNFMRLLEVCGPYLVTHKKERLIRHTAAIPRPGPPPCDPGCQCRKHFRHRRPQVQKHDWDAVAAMVESGTSISETARVFKTSRSHIYKILRRKGASDS